MDYSTAIIDGPVRTGRRTTKVAGVGKDLLTPVLFEGRVSRKILYPGSEEKKSRRDVAAELGGEGAWYVISLERSAPHKASAVVVHSRMHVMKVLPSGLFSR